MMRCMHIASHVCSARYLTEKEAVSAVGYAHRAYAITAWRFLTKTGFINFGVAAGMSAKQAEAPKGTIIVVGAGMAGLLHTDDLLLDCLCSCMSDACAICWHVFYRRIAQHYPCKVTAICSVPQRACHGLQLTNSVCQTASGALS